MLLCVSRSLSPPPPPPPRDELRCSNYSRVHAVQSEGDKVIIAERGELVFVFNFHPTSSYSDYRVGCKEAGPYKVHASAMKWPHS